MKQEILKTLEEKKIFKLVLGLGNQDFKAIEGFVKIYAKAGADMIDINPSKEAVESVIRGLELAGKTKDEVYLSISAGVTGDTHIQKCIIDNEKCKRCGKCVKKCPQNAIVFESKFPTVIKEKCIGCKKCNFCKAISFYSNDNNIENVVKIANEYDLECIELHVSTKKIPDTEIKYILDNSKCILSLCLDRKYYSNERLKKLIHKVIDWKGDNKFIIQADGVPMSGGDDTYKSTLQAVAMAHIVQDFGTYIFMSGGTNTKTSELAKLCSIRYNGISVGSFARKIVKDRSFDEAVNEAKKLIEACTK